MFHGDPLLRRVTEIIDHVVEAVLYKYWIYLSMNIFTLHSRKTAILHPYDGYYSFNDYHMQPPVCLILMG